MDYLLGSHRSMVKERGEREREREKESESERERERDGATFILILLWEERVVSKHLCTYCNRFKHGTTINPLLPSFDTGSILWLE